MKSVFDYRIVETPDHEFMVQRGASGNIDGISSKVYWSDALAQAVPTLDLAKQYLQAVKVTDGRMTPGTVVESEERA